MTETQTITIARFDHKVSKDGKKKYAQITDTEDNRYTAHDKPLIRTLEDSEGLTGTLTYNISDNGDWKNAQTFEVDKDAERVEAIPSQITASPIQLSIRASVLFKGAMSVMKTTDDMDKAIQISMYVDEQIRSKLGI